MLDEFRREMELHPTVEAEYLELDGVDATFDTRRSRIIVLLNLLRLSYADGAFEIEEECLLKEVGRSFGVTDEEFRLLDNWVRRFLSLEGGSAHSDALTAHRAGAAGIRGHVSDQQPRRECRPSADCSRFPQALCSKHPFRFVELLGEMGGTTLVGGGPWPSGAGAHRQPAAVSGRPPGRGPPVPARGSWRPQRGLGPGPVPAPRAAPGTARTSARERARNARAPGSCAGRAGAPHPGRPASAGGRRRPGAPARQPAAERPG